MMILTLLAELRLKKMGKKSCGRILHFFAIQDVVHRITLPSLRVHIGLRCHAYEFGLWKAGIDRVVASTLFQCGVTTGTSSSGDRSSSFNRGGHVEIPVVAFVAAPSTYATKCFSRIFLASSGVTAKQGDASLRSAPLGA